MKVYMAICTTVDPDVGNTSVNVLGVFSTRELANAAFTRTEKVTNPDGMTWTHHHICYKGDHEVKELDVDEWYP